MKHFNIIQLIVVLMLFGSCQEHTGWTSRTEIVLVVDKSQSQKKPDSPIGGFLSDLVNKGHLIETGDALTLHFVECGSNPIPSTDKVVLHGTNMLMKPRYEREDEVNVFLSEANAKFDTLISDSFNESQSQIYRTLVHAINILDVSADVRQLYYRSDFIESSPLADWEKIEAFDYDKLTKTLFADQPLPESVRGLEVVLIVENTTEQSLQAVRIYERILREAGAIVKVTSSFEAI
ncbi:MAG: hypothetical protein AAFY41_01400 [Bacteroidota bacterium]